ncbi:PAS domain S-box protein [Pseudomonadota bacterium]
MRFRWRQTTIFYAIIALSVTLAMIASATLSTISQTTLNRLLPLVDASSRIELELTQYHLWFEEYVHGDEQVSAAKVFNMFERARQSVQDMRAETQRGLPLSSDERDELLSELQLSHSLLLKLRSIGDLRLIGRAQGNEDRSNLDDEFDTNYNLAIASADRIKALLNGVIQTEVAFVRQVSYVMNALFAALGLAAILIIRRQDRLRRSTQMELQKLGRGVEQSPASILITDIDGVIQYVNPKFEAVTGYTRTEIIGLNPRILQSGDKKPEAYKAMWDTITAGHDWHGEFHNKRKDGTLFWELASISPIRDEDGVITNFVAVKEDITQRKIDDELLAQSRELFIKAFQSSPNLIALSHPDTGVHVDVNEGWLKTLKFTRDEVIGHTAFELDIWANVQDREAILRELEQTGRIRNFEAQLKASDGTLIDCIISSEPIDMNHQPLVMWTAMDITKRRNFERQLEYQRSLFEAIFQGIPDAVVYADIDRRIVAVNPGLQHTFGYTQDELEGHPTSMLYASDEEFSRQGKLRYHTGADAAPTPYVVSYKHKDGTEFPGETLGTPITDRDGNPLGFIGVIRDITQRQQIEHQLIQAKEEAEYANYAKSQFLANMSHELRTPLNAINGFADMMQLEAFGPLGQDDMGKEKYMEYVTDIRAAGGHLLSIITDILDVSKIEAGRLDLNEGEVDLHRVASSCMMLMEVQAYDKKVRVRCNIPDDLPNLHADELRLKQVFINLVSNAIKFNTEGGRVDVEALVNGDGGVVLIFTDTGIGIDDTDLARVLEPFGQVSDILTRPHEGSGLGLSLSRALIELHGGRMTIESTPGEGTQITCIFPPERTIEV